MGGLLGDMKAVKAFTGFSIIVLFALLSPWIGLAAPCEDPILFVTQVPIPSDFANVVSTFGSHRAGQTYAPPGGDLYIRYTDGTLKNLTAGAGYGSSGMQGATAIAVRDPAVHWSGTKAIFSMYIGAPSQRYQLITTHWQLYEISGLGLNDTPVITKVPNQPQNYNNIMPAYGTNGRIIFASDRPRDGSAHLYPQLDEYESTPTVSGLWSLDPESGNLFLLTHSPSGAFDPAIDSFGRVVFTQWDHLQRDQQNLESQPYFEAKTYFSEDENSDRTSAYAEHFPEPRSDQEPDYDSKISKHSFNHFFPWQINEDGTNNETVNHIGRQEFQEYLEPSFLDDPALDYFYGQYNTPNANTKSDNLHGSQESNKTPGLYYAINAPEFGTHASGQVISMYAPPNINADNVTLSYITHPDTSTSDDTPSSNHSGLYRNPMECADGTIIVSHTAETRADQNQGSSTSPLSRYDYRIKPLINAGNGYKRAGNAITSGISKSISYWSPDELISYSGVLWELQPTEVRARTVPTSAVSTLEAPEKSVFDDLGIDPEALKSYLFDNNLALIVSRNVTRRDDLDIQQPFNLKIANSTTKTTKGSAKIYEISHLQIFSNQLIRAYKESQNGRRGLARELDMSTLPNPEIDAEAGSVELGSDGSMAAFVPARRALTWQLLNPSGTPVVRERYWVTFARGEIRVCASCHGINDKDQAGNSAPQNAPLALRNLLQHWANLPKDGGTSYSISLSQKGMKGGKNFVAGPVKLALKGKAETNYSLQLAVNKKGCANSVPFTTDSSGRKIIKFKLSGPAKLNFTLVEESIERAAKKITVAGALKKGAAAKICQAFGNAN